MKKCPNCGSDVPIENNTCNHCGYSFSGKSGTIFTSVKGGSQGSNSEVFAKTVSHSLVSKIGKIFFTIVFAQVVFVIVTIIIFRGILFSFSKDVHDESEYDDYYTCYSLCDGGNYVEFNNKCVCDNDNIYNKNTGEMIYDSSIDMSFDSDTLAKCRLYCDEDVVNYNSDTCFCTDGRLYDFSGNEVFSEIPNHRTVQEWYSDVKSGGAVVTVLCKNNVSDCLGYKYKMDDLAFRTKINYYYFNLDLLDEEEKSLLLDTYDLQLVKITGTVPYTFVIKDDEFKHQFIYHIDTDIIIENTLIQDGIIEQ